MKITAQLFFIPLIIIACTSSGIKRKTDPRAKDFNNKIITLSNYSGNTDSCKKALLYLDSATAIDNNCFLCYMNKIMFLIPLKEYNKSLTAINNCIRIKPYAIDLYLNRGMIYEKMGDTVNAVQSYHESLEISNKILDTMKTSNSQYIMISINKASSLIMLNDTAQGDSLLKNLYDKLPSYPNAGYEEKEFIGSMLHTNKRAMIKMFESPSYSSTK